MSIRSQEYPLTKKRTEEWLIKQIRSLNYSLKNLAKDWDQERERIKEEKKQYQFADEFIDIYSERDITKARKMRVLSMILYNSVKRNGKIAQAILQKKEEQRKYEQKSSGETRDLKKKSNIFKSEPDFQVLDRNIQSLLREAIKTADGLLILVRSCPIN